MAVPEVRCYSMTCARETERCGADRIKLCAAPQEGGLTPSYGVLASVREMTTLLVHSIARSHGDDFCYTEEGFAAMLSDICMVWELGFPGVVTGVLNADGQVDIPRMKEIMVAAGPLAVTSHRAFDPCVDPHQVWKTLGELGVKRTLTSGQ